MKIDDIFHRQTEMESSRTIFESHWKEIAERVLPRSNYFMGSGATPGEKRTDKVFDSTATLALERFAAAMESMLTPRTKKWHTLTTGIEELQDDVEVQTYLEAVTSILFRARYSPKANFAAQTYENYTSLGAFGSGALFLDDDLGRGLRYKAIHLAEIYFAEDFTGRVDTVHRKFEMTARQIMQRWEKTAPTAIRETYREKPDAKYEVIHCVYPNSEMDTQRRDYRGMPWASKYVLRQPQALLEDAGYRTFPYAISRYTTSPREIYGRSPAMTVLPDIKMLNEMQKTTIRAAHRSVDPPLLAHEDGVLAGFNATPGAINYGGVSADGRQLVVPLETGANFPLSFEMADQSRKIIQDAFLITLFQILVDAPQMTATEAMLRAQEKGALLAPAMGRQQSEMLGPMIERELDILATAGVLPPMPQKLIEAGGMVDVEYVSPLNLAQRADEGVAILRTLESIAPLAQIDPSVMDTFNASAVARELAEINGVPAKVMRSKEEVEAMQENRANAQQAQALLQAAPVVSSSAKDLAQAQALAGSAGGAEAMALLGRAAA
jgi:hypothetical protein